MSAQSLVKVPYAAMAYVADNDTKELLVTTSEDGVWWSPPHRTGQSTNSRPVLAAFENQLVLLFHPTTNPKALMYCSSRNAKDWSPARHVPSSAMEDGRVAGMQSPALVAFNGPEPGEHMHLSYAPEYDLIHCRTARPASRNPLEFEFLPADTLTIEDKTKKDGISRRFSHGRRAVAVLDNKLIMAFVKNNVNNTLSYTSSVDVRSMHTWQSPQDIVTNAVDPAIGVLNQYRRVDDKWVRYRKLVVAWRYDDGSNRLGVATVGDDGKLRDFANMGELTKYGPALTTMNNVAVLAFVAANKTNELLACISMDGVNWSANERTGHNSSMPPALATSYYVSSTPDRR